VSLDYHIYRAIDARSPHVVDEAWRLLRRQLPPSARWLI